MPLRHVRISLPQNTTPPEVAAIATAVNNAPVATFNVPVPDRFRAIQLYDQEELVCSPEFLGIKR